MINKYYILSFLLLFTSYAYGLQNAIYLVDTTISVDGTLPVYFAEGDQIGNIIDGVDSAAIILGFPVDNVTNLTVTVTGNTVTVNSGGQSISTTIDNPEEGTTIQDSKGNLYAVDEKGNVTQVGKTIPDGETSGSSTNNFSVNSFDSEIQLNFENRGKWAFDAYDKAYEISKFADEFETLDGRITPWKFVPIGKSDKISAKLYKGSIDLSKIKFKTPTGTEFYAKEKGGKLEISLIGAKQRDGYELFAVYEENDSTTRTIGKINIASYPLLERHVTIVPMQSGAIDKSSLETTLNNIYKTYGITWEVTIADAFTDRSWDADNDGSLMGTGTKFYSSLTKEMSMLNTNFTAQRGMDDKSLYLFWFTNDAKTKDEGAGVMLGDMPLESRFGYIFSPTITEQAKQTIAHELAHGAFQLRHTFSDKYNIKKNSTKNLMDYSGGTELTKYQWDLIHDPATMLFAWAQDDSEGAAYMTLVTKEGKGIGIDLPDYEKNYCFLTPTLIPIWIKDAEEIKFFDNGTVSSFIVGGVKYSAIVSNMNNSFNCYYEYADFLLLEQDESRQEIDGLVLSQDLDQNKIYSNYQLAKQDDPTFIFTDYTRLGINCIKIESFKVSNTPEAGSKISGQIKDPELPETTIAITKSGECESLDIVKQYNISDGIGRDFFILFYPGCNDNQTKIDELVSFSQKLNQDEADNCNETKYQITDAFAKKLRNDGITTLESFLDNYYIGYSLGALVISDVDLWIYLTDDYNSVSKWEYSAAELKVRYKLLQSNDPLAKGILENETIGNAQPLTGEAFVRKYGDASSLVAFILFFQLEAELLDISAGVEVANRVASMFKRAKTKPFTTGSMTNKKILRGMKLNQLDEGLEAVLKNLDNQVKQLDGVKPADNTLTSLSKKLFDENAMKIAPSEGPMKNLVDDIVKNGDNAGNKTEELSDLLYVRNGFNKVDNVKLNGDQGFDGVYIKGSVDNPTEIIINEAKQMNSSAVKLSPANFDTGLPAQMSDGWVENVANRLIATGEGEKVKLGQKLLANPDKITKVLTTVDKSTGEIKILKLTNY